MPTIDTSMLEGQCLPSSVIAEQTNLPGVVVVNTACYGDDPDLAGAFLTGGATAYIASDNGDAASVFLTLFFWECLARGAGSREAWRRAASYDHDCARWIYFDETGRSESSNRPGISSTG